jgi:hypothetical protein
MLIVSLKAKGAVKKNLYLGKQVIPGGFFASYSNKMQIVVDFE